MVNLFFLKTFLDTAKSGSLSVAAQKNYVTQPAVTQHIRILEEKLECKLFERKKRKVVLTPSGEALLAHAESILRQYDSAKTHIGQISGRTVDTLCLATIYSIGLYELQNIVQRFLQKSPEVDIRLEYFPFHKIQEMTASHDIDFGFVAFPSHTSGVVSEVFAEEKMVLVQSTRQRLFKGAHASFKDLAQTKYVAFAPHSPTRNAIDAYLRGHQCTPQIVNEYDNVETLKSAVLLGIGCSIVPEVCVLRELKSKTLEVVALKGLSLKRPLALLHSKKNKLSTAAKQFREMVLDKKQAIPDNKSHL